MYQERVWPGPRGYSIPLQTIAGVGERDSPLGRRGSFWPSEHGGGSSWVTPVPHQREQLDNACSKLEGGVRVV